MGRQTVFFQQFVKPVPEVSKMLIHLASQEQLH